MPPRSDRLPSAIAVPLTEYAAETHPVLRLHRLCDAVEILTRFCAVAALSEHRSRHGDEALPPELLAQLQDHIERPTLGRWTGMLAALVEHLGRSAPLVLPELPDVVTRLLVPLLPGGDRRTAYESVLALRNDLAHGGGLTRAVAEEFLSHWEPRLEPLWQGLAFLEGAAVCLYDGKAARRLAGPTQALGEEAALTADLRQALHERGLAGHVVLLRGGRWLDLWPLCGYGRAVAQTPHGPRPAKADSPLVYFRAAPRRLTYVALGSDRPFGEGSSLAVDAFRRLFQLDRRIPEGQRQAADFEEELAADAAALVGRKAELEGAVALLREARTGVFWVGGRGGIGKSFLMAALCRAPKLREEPRKALVVGWRFKASDQARGSRTAFFRHAVGRVAEWLGRADVTPSADPGELETQLGRLLDEAAARTAPDPRGRPPRVLFFLDALDEIERLDPGFADVPFVLSRPNVIWVCAGRPEGRLPEVFSAARCTPVFGEGGLPAMSGADVRAMLVGETGALKYDLLRADREESSAVVNDVARAVVERAEGLPLYVHFVIEDIRSGHYRFEELPERLPPGLAAYFDDLLRRLSVGALQALLTPLVVTIAWAKAPLDEATLHELMVRRKVAVPGEKGRALVRRGLEAVQSMVRPTKGAGQEAVGYEPYHLRFRDHVRRDEGEVIGQQNELAREEFCALAREAGRLPPGHPARWYALRYGPQTLLDNGRVEDVAALLLDLHYLEAKAEAGLVFELAADFTAAVKALPAGEQRRTLDLLEGGLRRDIHFLNRHPQALFQCLWNSGWWYDHPEAAGHYEPAREGSDPPPWERAGPKLYELLERWRREKEQGAPGFRWLRSVRPPRLPLGTGKALVLRGHGAGLTCVEIALNGERIVSADEGGTVCVWDAVTGRRVATWDGAVDDGCANRRQHLAAISPDGEQVALAGREGVRVLQVVSGEESLRLSGLDIAVTCVAFSPDGGRLLSGSEDGTVRVWDVRRGTELACLRGHEMVVVSVSATARAERVLTASEDDTLRFWDGRTAEQLLSLPADGYIGYVCGAALSADGSRCASGGIYVVLRGLPDGGVLSTDGALEGVVSSVAISANGRRVVAASFGDDYSAYEEVAVVLETDEGREAARLEGHHQRVTCVAVSGDGRRVVTGSADCTVRVWDAEQPSSPPRLVGHRGAVRCLTLSPDGTRAASLDGGSNRHDSALVVWDTGTGRLLHQDRRRRWPGAARLCFSPDNQRLLLAGRKPDPRYLLEADQKVAQVYDLPSRSLRGMVVPLRFSWPSALSVANGVRAAVCGPDEAVRVWDVGSGDQLRLWPTGAGGANCVTFSPDGRGVAAGTGRWDSAAFTVCVWDVESGATLRVWNAHEKSVSAVAFSPDGRRVASAAFDKTVRLWDLETGAAVLCLGGHDDRCKALAFSLDGRWLVSGGHDGTARVWDLGAGREQSCFRGHDAYVDAVAFAPDGRTAASGGWDNTVRLWDVTTGVERLCLRGHTHSLKEIVFTPAGDRLVSTDQKTVRVWDAVTGAESLRLDVPIQFGEEAHLWTNGVQVAAASGDTVHFFDAVTGAVRGAQRGWLLDPDRLTFSADGRHVVGQGEERIRAWDAETGAEVQETGSLPIDRTQPAGHYRVSVEDGETVVRFQETGEAVAWFVEPLELATSGPGGTQVAGAVGSQVYVLELAGGERGR